MDDITWKDFTQIANEPDERVEGGRMTDISKMTDEELTRAIAKKVMNLTGELYTGIRHNGEKIYSYIFPDGIRRDFLPLTDANHMMMVVERMTKKGWDICLEIFCVRPKIAHAHFYKMGQYEMEVEGQAVGLLGRAVCMAALIAEGEKK
jgi:hypothetical protein